MCGLSGFVNIQNSEARFKLISSLGRGIDTRGQAMAGFISSNKENDFFFSRKKGSWSSANDDFIMAAAHGSLCMMHSRAPGYTSPITDAHPFPIVRNGETVLWGSHNGSLDNAWKSAEKHSRKITVDSMELFELIADKEYDTLHKSSGWGVVEWIEASNKNEVKLSRLTQHSELVAVSIKGRGTVWASTWAILKQGLAATELEIEDQYSVNDIGRVYIVNEDGLFPTDNTNVHLANRY